MDQPQLFTDSRYLFMHRSELVEGGVHQQPARHSRGGRPVTNAALVTTTSPSTVHVSNIQIPARIRLSGLCSLARSLPPPWKTRKEDAGQVRPPVTVTLTPAPPPKKGICFFFPASQPARALRSTIAFASSDRVPRHTRRGGSGTTGGPRRTAHSSSRSCGAG